MTLFLQIIAHRWITTASLRDRASERLKAAHLCFHSIRQAAHCFSAAADLLTDVGRWRHGIWHLAHRRFIACSCFFAVWPSPPGGSKHASACVRVVRGASQASQAHKLKGRCAADRRWLAVSLDYCNESTAIYIIQWHILAHIFHHEVNTAKGNSRRHDCGGGAPPVGSL